MKKNILKYCSVVLLTLVLGFSFTACEKDEDSSVHLDAFGPSPALRGGELRFLGQNIDKVTEIILPSNVSVKTINVVSNGEIRITVPQNVVPGIVTLKTPEGDIVTKTELTLSEPISISKFYKTGSDGVASVVAGDEITFEGDYLNLIREVVFTDNVVVSLNREENKDYPRESFTVRVPLEAQTGKIALSNGENMPILVYTETDLTVAVPTVKTISPTTVKAESNITIKGEHLQGVKEIRFTGDTVVAIKPLKDPYEERAELTLQVPYNVKDGDVTLISYSGVEVKAGTITMVVPTISAVDPNPVKGGTTLTITGTNLDLVTNITFPNVEEAVDVKSQTATTITVDVPLEAIDGKIGLNTNSGKTVEKAYTTVKATISNITPLSLTAGEEITITGTNLDMVRSIEFGGGISVDISPASATSFVVATPMTAENGKVTLVMANEVKVVSTQSLEITPANRPVITDIDASVKPGAMLTIKGTHLNQVESITFANNVKATQYGTRSATLIEVYVPENAKRGTVTITLKGYDGIELVSPSFNIAGTDPVVDPALVIFDFEDRGGNNSANNAGGWGGIANGKSTAGDGVSGDFFEITASNWNAGAYWWIADNWIEAPYPSVSGISNYVLKMDIRLRHDVPVGDAGVNVRMAGNKEANILPYLKQGNLWTTGGEWTTITIPLSAFSGLDDPTATGGDWGVVKAWINDNTNFTGLCIDNIRYEKK